jgi:hypothetical protein
VVSQLEDYFTPEYDTYLGRKTPTKSLDQVQQDLNEIELKTGTKPAIIYAFFTSTQEGSAEGSDKTQQMLSDVRGLPRLGCNPSESPDTCQLALVLVTTKGTPVFVRSPNSSRSSVIKQAGLLYLNRLTIWCFFLMKSSAPYPWPQFAYPKQHPSPPNPYWVVF